MKEIIVIIRPQNAQATRKALEAIGINAYTTVRVLGRSRQGGLRYPRKWFKRSADIRFLPKRMFSIVLEDHQLEPAVAALTAANRTGQVGDGKIFILPVEEMLSNDGGVEHETLESRHTA
ncbi:MAG TPA: P-II family nitrogen regulator [Nitrospiria bacterium]